MAFASHHVGWYASRGVEAFHYILHSERVPQAAMPLFSSLAKKHNVRMHLYLWAGTFDTAAKLRRMGRIVRAAGQRDVPLVIADMDEFIDVDLTNLYTPDPCIYGRYVDALAAEPPCVKALELDTPILEQFPVHKIGYARSVGCGGVDTKPVVLFRPHYSQCHTYRRWPLCAAQAPVSIYHVRWTTDRMAKSARRYETFMGCAHRGRSKLTVGFLEACRVVS